MKIIQTRPGNAKARLMVPSKAGKLPLLAYQASVVCRPCRHIKQTRLYTREIRRLCRNALGAPVFFKPATFLPTLCGIYLKLCSLSIFLHCKFTVSLYFHAFYCLFEHRLVTGDFWSDTEITLTTEHYNDQLTLLYINNILFSFS